MSVSVSVSVCVRLKQAFKGGNETTHNKHKTYMSHIHRIHNTDTYLLALAGYSFFGLV